MPNPAVRGKMKSNGRKTRHDVSAGRYFPVTDAAKAALSPTRHGKVTTEKDARISRTPLNS
jgi:hypothetical protein